MVVFTLRLLAPPRLRGEILQMLRSAMGPTLAERGCRNCHLQQDADDPNLLTFTQEWEAQEDVDRHMASNEYRKVLAAMDMADAPPDVTFLTVLGESGFERIAAARQHLAVQEGYGS
jgi:quinol monooxygenase YgiN